MMKYNNIVLNIPHASCEGIAESGWTLSAEFFDQIRMWTDWYTDYLFMVDNTNIKVVRSSLSRFVIDTERLLNDPLEEKGAGIIYKHFQEFTRNLHDREKSLLMQLYNSHQQQLRQVLSEDTVLIDCHSFPSMLSDFDICIGYNEDWSKPDEETLSDIIRLFTDEGLSIGVNDPYSNSISPVCSFTYHSFMIEVNKHVYLDEETLKLTPGASKLKGIINNVYKYLLNDTEPGGLSPEPLPTIHP